MLSELASLNASLISFWLTTEGALFCRIEAGAFWASTPSGGNADVSTAASTIHAAITSNGQRTTTAPIHPNTPPPPAAGSIAAGRRCRAT